MSYQDPNQQNQYPNSGPYSGGYNPSPEGQPQPTDPYSGQQGGYPPYGQPQQPNQYQQPGPGGYQQQYGQPPYGGQQGAYGGPNLGPSSMNMDPKLGGALSYLTWVVGLIFFLMEKQNRFIRFHAMQSMILWLSPTAIYLVARVIGPVVPILGVVLGCVGGLIGIAAFVGAIVAGIKAYQGEYYKLPIIGEYAEKYANQGTTL